MRSDEPSTSLTSDPASAGFFFACTTVTHLRPLRLTLTTPPDSLPVTLDEIKSQLNLDDAQTDDDPLISGFIRSAVGQAESFTGRVLITQTWTAFWDGWPRVASDFEPLGEGWHIGPETLLDSPGRQLLLPKPRLQSVVHVKTFDDSDVATVFAASNYFVDTASEPGRLVLRKSVSAPTITRTANGLEIQFKAGYGDNPGDVEQGIRDGILQLVAFMYENRGDCPPEKQAIMGSGAGAMWQPYAIMRL